MIIPTAILTSLLFAAAAAAQTAKPLLEIGVQLTAIDARAFEEKPPAAGGRVTVSLFRFVDAEAEVNRFPIGGAVSLFPGTQVLVGTRLGLRIGPVGLYAKVRPGFVRFDTNPYAPRLGTHAALDIGGVLELYARRHFAVRLDFGDTAVFYGSTSTLPPSGGGAFQLGARHQPQCSLGVSAWF